MRWIALAAVLIGCGSGGETSETDALSGTRWGRDFGGFECSEGIGFNRDQSYDAIVLCTLTDGSLGAQVVAGDYSADDNTLSIVNRSASCPGIPRVVSLSFAMSASSLTLSSPTGGAIYTRLPPPSGSGGFTFGCFGTDGAFSPMAIHAL